MVVLVVLNTYENTLSELPVSVVLYFASGLPAGPRLTNPVVVKTEPWNSCRRAAPTQTGDVLSVFGLPHKFVGTLKQAGTLKTRKKQSDRLDLYQVRMKVTFRGWNGKWTEGLPSHFDSLPRSAWPAHVQQCGK